MSRVGGGVGWRALALALALMGVPGAGAQEPKAAPRETRPTFPGEIELVTVDAVVTDKEGNPVRGLLRGDFLVAEEGVPQVVSSFEAVELPASPSEAPRPRSRLSTNMDPDRRQSRSFVIVFDDLHLTPQRARQAKGAIAVFLSKGVREGDHVSLLATSGDAWWNTLMETGREDLLAILRRLDGRRIPDGRLDHLSDWEAMRISQFNDTLVAQRVTRRFQSLRLTPESTMPSGRIEGERANREERDSYYGRGINDLTVQARAAEMYYSVRHRGTQTLSSMERALESLSGAKGRKSMILVSDGFILDTGLDEFKQVVEAARRSNVAIYFVNTRGLQGLESLYGSDLLEPIAGRDMGAVLADLTQEAAGSEHLAQDTGGFTVRNTNDLDGGIQRIGRESLGYYLLGYTPTANPRDGSYRRINVKVRGKGMSVRARKGYYAPRAENLKPEEKGRKEADADIQRALDSPFMADQIPLKMTAYVRDEVVFGKARTLVAAEIDVTDLAFRARGTDGSRVGTLHFLLVVGSRTSADAQREDKEVEIVLRPNPAKELERTWYAVTREFQLAPGWYQAKLVVRDGQDRRVGTVAHEFEVPALDRWRVSSPILSDRLQPRSGDTAPSPVVLADRRFGSGGSLFCQFDVYGATKGEVTGLPQVSAGYALVRADGTTVSDGAPTRIGTTSLGYVSRLWAMGLAGVEPGQYELVITVRDEIAAEEQVLREPLTITDEPAPPS